MIDTFKKNNNIEKTELKYMFVTIVTDILINSTDKGKFKEKRISVSKKNVKEYKKKVY